MLEKSMLKMHTRLLDLTEQLHSLVFTLLLGAISQLNSMGNQRNLHGKYSLIVIVRHYIYAIRGLADTTIKIDEIVTGLETFVLNLYCKQRPNSVENLSSLRWYLFSKHQFNSDKLPPTSSALNTKILRSHFVSTLWSQSHCSQIQLLDPTTHGWKRLIDESLQPITTDLPPAPEAIVEMSLCKCKRSCDTKCLHESWIGMHRNVFLPEL